MLGGPTLCFRAPGPSGHDLHLGSSPAVLGCGLCRGPRFAGEPHCCGMYTLGAWCGDTPRQAAGCDMRGGPGPGLCRASPVQGTHLSIHPCDLCWHGSARASGLFLWCDRTLGLMLLGGTALSHFCQGEWVLAARLSIPCKWRWVRLHGFIPHVPSVLRAAPAGGKLPCGGADPLCRDKSWLEGLLWGCSGCFWPKIGCLNSLVAHGTAASRGSSWRLGERIGWMQAGLSQRSGFKKKKKKRQFASGGNFLRECNRPGPPCPRRSHPGRR